MVEKSEEVHLLDNTQRSILGTWRSLCAKSKCVLAILFVGSMLVALGFAAVVNVATDTFTTGPLSGGQIMAFVLCTFVMAWALADTVALQLFHVNLISLGSESRARLRSGAEFCMYLFLMFFCDRTSLLPRMKKWYTPDSFWFMWITLVAASLCTLTKVKNPPSIVVNGHGTAELYHVPPLTRTQTEEWKGWMQVLFLWYHYFHNVSIYNSIRLFIAAYVWMTGFGNFSYYYVRKDFSLSRFCETQWRLNFLVTATCAVLGNQYMLYYICPLHTLFTLFIYGSLACFQDMNRSNRGVCIKVCGLFVVCFLLWDISEEIFYVLWFPFKWLLRYDDPYRPGRDVMSEWFFRTFLDHYIWIYGMICAYCHPKCDGWLKRLDEMPRHISWLVKSVIVCIALVIGYVYVNAVYLLPKAKYNRVHPYTSLIPITIYIVLRNIFMRGRMYHSELFATLGKVTLESYISQFHLWMATTGLNGSPKLLLRIVPEEYPMVNFALTSIVLCVVSFRLFATTNVTRTFFIPPKASSSVLKNNIATVGIFMLLLYIVSCCMQFATAR
ncbi:putative CAS1 domain-containing protein 1-like isoform X2 [Trypanosoma grayi]|uniref:putative CAS1 domain-containing protein 1-like isoform X2 n=1 Tax=Trypanosoma grayi TaxID=71804 RepID=UPI0004F414E5|nr:putative CAS1 domain-containing protein 1-like isoform X2 [Trypanosoma grayi]KEG13869.1 putative CAS1 domain-containing protein 1-like isoform X2 [Trypanosoma grayi]